MNRLHCLAAFFAILSLPTLAMVSAADEIVVSGSGATIKSLGASRRAAIADGAGGMFVAWQGKTPPPCGDPITCPTHFHVFVQRVLANGAIAAGWSADGVRASTDTLDQTQPVLVRDLAGGVVVAWTDAGTGARIRAQRLDGTGHRVAGWPANGVPLSGGPGLYDRDPTICSDAAGGALVAWTDQGQQILLAQHVTAAGTIAPGWPAGGLPLCQAPGTHSHFDLCPDGSGGLLVAWEDTRAGVDPDLYAQHVTSSGAIAPGWIRNGNPVSTAVGWQRSPQVCSDDAGGMLLTWMDNRNDPNDIYAQHLHGDGGVAAGWQDGGVPICSATGGQWNPAISADGSGGAIVAWFDRRDAQEAIYATRITGAGSISAGWPANGAVVMSGPSSDYQKIVSDGGSGAIVSWDDGPGGHIFAQRMTGSGSPAPGWPFGGMQVAATAVPLEGADPVSLVASADGAAFLVWADDLSGPAPGNDIVASHADGSGNLLAISPNPEARPEFSLAPLRPNPATGPLSIDFAIRAGEPARLELVDVTGRLFARKDLGEREAGMHHATLATQGLHPGVYWIRLSQGGRAVSRRAAILR